MRALVTRDDARAAAFALRMLLIPAPDLDAWERTRDYPLIPDGVLAHDDPEWREAASARRLVLPPDRSASAAA